MANNQLQENPELFWFMPTHGDGRVLGKHEKIRRNFDYYFQIASALDHLGFDGILMPTGNIFEESWVASSALATFTKKIEYLIAVRPSMISPVYLAHQVSSLSKVSTKPVSVNIVVGANQQELYASGVFFSPEDRYKRASEFVGVYKSVIMGEDKEVDGDFYKLEKNQFRFNCEWEMGGRVFSAGDSEAGKDFAAKYSDVYLMWGNTPEDTKNRIDEMRDKAQENGRQIRFGIRVHLVLREDDNLAWQEAKYIFSGISGEEKKLAINRVLKEKAVAQRNVFNKHIGDEERLEISPNLWAGVGLARGGALTALVGGVDTIARRVKEYSDMGVSLFIFSGTPHLEESYNVAHLLFPHLRK